MSAGTIRVLIADDQPLLVSALATIIGAQPDIDVVATAATGNEALRQVERHVVDVVVMDVRMPELDGVEATRLLTSRSGAPRVLVLTTFNEDALVRGALEAGADGFLLKDADPAELAAAIRTVFRGEFVVSSAASGHLVQVYREAAARKVAVSAATRQALASLTPREVDVLAAVAEGASNTEIAERLSVAESTVKTHVSSLLAKLHCRNRVALVVLAHRSGRE